MDGHYLIFERVIIQSEKGGFDEWTLEKDQPLKVLAEYLLSYIPFSEEIFYDDFAQAFFHGEKEDDNLKRLQEMVISKNPFNYLKNIL